MARIFLCDLETTGLDASRHEILEIGGILFDKDTCTILDVIDIKVKPERPEDGDPKAYFVNGYTKEDWKDAIGLHEAMLIVSEKAEKSLFMSYSVTFDWSFMQAAFKKTGIEDPFHYHRLDLLTLAWSKIPHSKMGSWALKSVCSYLNIPPEPKVHRGMNGAMKSYEVYRRLAEMK